MIYIKYIFISLFLTTNFIFSQSNGEEKFSEMKHSFILGLADKGLEIATELMSRKEYVDQREETIFYIAEYFYVNASSAINSDMEQQTVYASKSYTYYLGYLNEYPNSKYSTLAQERIKKLESLYETGISLKNYFDSYQNEANVVYKKMDFIQSLYSFRIPTPYLIFFDKNVSIESLETLDKYYDDIIANHPDFELYAYYFKIITNLSVFNGIDFVDDGLMPFNVEKLKKNLSESEGVTVYSKINGWLKYLDTNYPKSSVTLNLHLIIAWAFMVYKDGTYDLRTKKHLEYIIENEPDKTSPRYLLSKNFLENNKFRN
jgi:hypothetical protein